MKTIIDALEETSKIFPQKIFIKTSTEELTYYDIYQKIQYLSSSLNKYPEKSVISMIFDNCPEFIISYLGIFFLFFNFRFCQNLKMERVPHCPL